MADDKTVRLSTALTQIGFEESYQRLSLCFTTTYYYTTVAVGLGLLLLHANEDT